jgi:hypothetical protein
LLSGYFSQMHNIHINIQIKCLGEILHVWSKTELLQPMAHRTMSGALAGALHELAALGFSRRSSTKIHRTSGVPPDYPVSPRSNGRLHQRSTAGLCPQSAALEVRGQSATTGRTGLFGVPPDCPVHQKGRSLERSTSPNPNDRLTWDAPNNEQ